MLLRWEAKGLFLSLAMLLAGGAEGKGGLYIA